MAKYKNIVVTNGGLTLIAAAHSGDTIEFTAIKTGAGIYDGTEVLAEATALKDIKQTLGISGLTKNESVIKVNTVLTNEGVDEAYKITELGLYAKDSSGNEILYAIVVAEEGKEDYLPAYADAPTTATFEIYVDANTYDKDITFQATVIAGTYATPQDVSDAVASMTSRMGTIQSSIMQEVNSKTNDINTYLRRDCKNLLEVTAITRDFGSFGTILTVNEDKSISLSGTQVGTNIQPLVGEAYLRANTEYILSGCPEGGSTSSYYLKLNNTDIVDIGDGVTFTVEEDGIYEVSTALIVNTSYDGIVLYPMIRLASIEDKTYEPCDNVDIDTRVSKLELQEEELEKTRIKYSDIVDNLSSTRTDLPISANQGNEVRNMLYTKAVINTYILTSGQSKNFKMSRGGASALVIVSIDNGPSGYGVYQLYYNNSNKACKILEGTSEAAFTTDVNTYNNGLTITASSGTGIKVVCTVISQHENIVIVS